jgi:hypothetical protein
MIVESYLPATSPVFGVTVNVVLDPAVKFPVVILFSVKLELDVEIEKVPF